MRTSLPITASFAASLPTFAPYRSHPERHQWPRPRLNPLGLLLLIATPIARVAFSIVGFALERDRMYVVFTLIVLAILLYSS